MGYKTYANWNCNLSEYLQIGDLVDEEMVEYFINVLPPVSFRSNLVQMGEPYSTVNGRETYATLYKTDEGWMYMGHCHAGKIEAAS